MSLVTVLRSPSTSESTSLGDSEVDEDHEDSSLNRSRASSFEGFFASKGAAYALPDGDFARRATKHGGEMQLHLQAMVNLLRDEDVLRLVVKLESQNPNRIRYLTIVSAFGPGDEEESIVMGVDWTDKATIGLVVPLYRDTNITLDGDGTALQWIHKCADNARRHNYFYPNGLSHAWVDYYNRKISSDRICLNEWHQMEDILSKRPESPIGTSTEKELVMKLIRHKLKEVMTRVDLEEVTSRQVRTILEEDTQMELREYRSFIDEEMFTILGQMDSASEIFDHVYLGSEWNASNLEELKENGVGYILNITREIDNFFPGTFCYHNIRVYDLDETELLHHWEHTYKFIQGAKNAGSKVLVHCRMGISRSASTVIAYGMKEYGWSLGDTMKYVKARRSIVQPNAGFWKQLITYEGILNSSKHRYNKLFTHEAELSEKGATKRKKIKKSGKTAAKTDEQLHPEDMDTVDNLSIESESDEQSEESSEERNEESGVLRATTDEDSGAVRVNTDGDLGDVRVTAEDNDDVFFSEDAVCQSKDDDSLPAISSPINPTVEPSKEVDEETDSIQSNSRVLQIPVMEKTELYRVCSLPVLPSNDKTKQEPNAQTNANFQRSRSLRERGPRKAQHLRNVLEGKASSDENITEFDRTKKGICDSTEENLCLNDRSSVETELESKAPGGIPSDLHGVLESGFVKRKSRNFEEGVYNVPSVKLVLDDAVDLEKEMDVEFAPSESDNPIVTEEEQEQSVHSEEPEPGLVKKHKEEYELKHRESLKRGAVLQRGGSGDGSSLKRERGDDIDAAGIKSLLGEDGSETEGACAVNVDALVQKVNEDMKKEVSARRISKKELELRAFVRQAGEEMEEALATTEDKNLERENENSVTDLGSRETSEVPSVEKKAKEMLLEDPPASGKSAECIETVASKVEKVDMRNDGSTATDIEQAVSATVDPSKNIVAERGETSELSEDREDITSEQDKENVSQESLVKRHTLLIEGRLQPLGQKLEKEGEGEVEKEGEPTVEQEAFSRSPSKEETKTAAVEIEPSVALDVNSDAVAQSTERETCDMSNEREDKASEQDTESVPQKGLVKRHTLLIEGRFQPLEQALAEAENEAEKESESKDDQQTCLSPSKEESRDVATNRLESSDEEGVSADLEPTEKEMNTTEKKETCELLEDTGDRVSEQDVLQKGLVKHHTQMIEGRLQPLGQELDREGEDKDEKVDEITVDQEACSSPSKVETKSAVLAPEKVLTSVAGDLNAEDKSTTEGEGADRSEDVKDKTNEHDEEQLSQRGLVKHHKLMIEGKLQPLVQDVENEDMKQGELTVDPEVFSFPSVDQGQRYQIEQTSNVTAEEDEGENQDGEKVSGLVKREKLRIEERVKPKVEEGEESKQEEDTIVTFNDGAMLLVSDGENGGCGDAENIEVAEDDRLGELLKEQELNEVSVDTSSVVRVKDHTEHLEGIIRVTTTKDGEKIKRQISKEDLPKSSDETPKIVIVPRSCSDERVGQENERSTSDMLIERGLEEILSDSAVNVALMKAQENLDLENEKFVDWDVANVKQRTRIFEDIRQHFDKNNQKDEDDDNPIRRCGSMPKTILPSQKYVLRRRSFSDLSQTVSSSSGRKVGYTIQFSNGQSSSSSSLPREWSPLQKKQENDTWDEVFSPEIYRQGELKEKTSEALIDCQDQENNSLSVKEKIQVLDSKNHRNTSNVS